jgi:type I restriction enzyme S subunit
MKVAGIVIELPKTWQWANCSEVIDVRDGTHETPKYVSEGYPLVTSKNLKPDGIDFSTISYISEKDHLEISKRSRVDRNDILFAMIGTIGNPVLVDIDTEFSIKNVALFKFANSPIDPRYFRYLLKTRIIERQLDFEERGGTQKFVSLKVLRNMKIPYPPLEEQRRIAAILDKADGVRRKRKEAIRLTEELLKSTFLEMFGDPVTNPKGWGVVSLGSLLKFLTSGSRGWARYYADNGSLFLRIQNVKAGRLLLDDIAYVDAPDSTEARRTSVQEGDVLVSMTADLGRTAVIPKGLGKAHINQHLALLRLDREYILPTYAAAFLASVGGQIQFDRLNREAVKAGLNFDDLRGIKILLPPLEKQIMYSDFLESQTNSLNRQKAASSQSENLFNSLLQRAFRGEL